MKYTLTKNHSKLFAASTSSNTPRNLCWLHLNEHDNNIDHCRATLAVALTQWSPEFTCFLREPTLAFPVSFYETFIIRFRPEIEKTPLILLVSNIELIVNKELLNFFDKLLAETIPGFELLILYDEENALLYQSGRDAKTFSDSPFYLSLEQEYRYYQSKGISLTQEDTAAIHFYTNGWPAAAQITSEILLSKGTLILQNLKNYLTHWIETGFLNNFTNPELVKLICLSLLDEMPPELIRDTFGWQGETYCSVLQANPIFRYNIDSKCFYFAAHMQEFLIQKQITVGNSEKHKFYKWVAEWFAERDDSINAVNYYLKINAYNEIYTLMKKWTLNTSRPMANCFIDAINRMPPEFIDKNPPLILICGRMLSTLYRYDEACLIMERYCSVADRGEETPALLKPLLGEMYIVWGNACMFTRDFKTKVKKLFQRANQLLPDGSRYVSPKLNLYADCPVIFLTEPDNETLAGNLNIYQSWELEISKFTRGGTRGASRLAAAEMEWLTRNLEKLETKAQEAIREALLYDQHDIVCSAYFLLMRSSLAKGNYPKTMENLKLLKIYAAEAAYETFFGMPDLAVSWLNLKLGKIHEVADWIKDESLYLKTIIPWNYGRNRVVYTTYLLLHHKYRETLSFTEATIPLFIQRKQHLLNINMYAAQAIAFAKLNEPEKSASVLETVYWWCHKNQIIMPLIELSNMLTPVINNYIETGRTQIPQKWLDMILIKTHTYSTYQHMLRRHYLNEYRDSDSALTRLTLEEQQTLYFLCQGLSVQKIADTQKRTYATIRGMLQRIYTKLNAQSRSDAVRIAVENHIEEYITI